MSSSLAVHAPHVRILLFGREVLAPHAHRVETQCAPWQTYCGRPCDDRNSEVDPCSRPPAPGDPSERSPILSCDDGFDNDGDGRADFDPVTFADHTLCSGDPGCKNSTSVSEDPQCQDGINNDAGQDPDPGKIDFDGGLSALGYVASDPDPQCVGKPWRNKEKSGNCGLGYELALGMAGLMWLRRRRERLAA